MSECALGAIESGKVSDKLKQKELNLGSITSEIEKQYKLYRADNPLNNTSGVCAALAQQKSLSGCGSDLPTETCSPFLGLTKGCQCAGKHVTEDKIVTKALDSALDTNAQRAAATTACFAGVDSVMQVYKSVSGALDYENKLMYFGSVDGAIAYYPGVLWARSETDQSCDVEYDPRQRAWYIAGSNGPKNVVFILDSSGSMRVNNRMDKLKRATKKLIDGLSMSDFVAIVDFDTETKTYKGNSFMARARKAYREGLKEFVDDMESGGSTMWKKAFEKAFEVVDTSVNNKYESNCQTVYVFLTDGENTSEDPTPMIQSRIDKLGARKEMFIIIGLGGDVGPDKAPGQKLKKLACDIGGIFESVPDSTGARTTDDVAMLKALSSFSRYFQTKNSIEKRDLPVFSEIYAGRNFPMDLVTVAKPVYDKSDPDRWKILGVVGIDVTVCDLEKTLYDSNPDIQQYPAWPEQTEIEGCVCAETYDYTATGAATKTYSGCTTDGWPNRWFTTTDIRVYNDIHESCL